MKKQKVIPRKKTGPAATGKGEPVVVRMHTPQLKALDAWIAQQEPPFPSRPEAVRRLVKLALANSKKQRVRYSEKIVAKAMELAARAIDGLMDPSASADEKVVGKRRLLRGPSVFRDVRVDQKK
jgi:Arc/MetJ-type ribon-helix-helix transcriptional regulator